MKVTRSEFSRRPFVMAKDDLCALADLATRVGKPEYSIACSDGLSRHFMSLDDLARFDNSPSRSIRRFTMSARTADSSSWFSLSLADEPYTNLQIQLNGPEPLIGDLNRELESRLAAMKPWYGVFTRGNMFLLGLAMLLVSALFLAALVAFGRLGVKPPASSSDRREAGSLVVSYGILAIWAVLA